MVELPAGKSKRVQKLVKPSPRLGLRVVNRRLWVAIAVGLGNRGFSDAEERRSSEASAQGRN